MPKPPQRPKKPLRRPLQMGDRVVYSDKGTVRDSFGRPAPDIHGQVEKIEGPNVTMRTITGSSRSFTVHNKYIRHLGDE